MQLAKYFAGAVAILLALWVIIGEQITGASSNAVVNAPISTTRAPIRGIISAPNHDLGRYYEFSEVIGKIENLSLDVSNLYSLQQQREIIVSEINSIYKSLTITNTEISDVKSLVDKYFDFAIVINAARIARSEERIRLFDEIEAARVTTKGAKLSAKSVQNSIELSREKEIFAVQNAIRSSFLNKIFVGEEFGELFQLQKKLLERKMFRSNLIVRLELLEEKNASFSKRILQEEGLTQSASIAILKSKPKSLLWEKIVSDGESVERGQEIYRTVDCSSAVVTLSVSKNVYNKLVIGQNALFFPDKSDLKYEAKITRLSGSGADRNYKHLAVPPSGKSKELFDVTLIAPKLREMTTKKCIVGRTGRVFFDGRPFDWLRDLIN